MVTGTSEELTGWTRKRDELKVRLEIDIARKLRATKRLVRGRRLISCMVARVVAWVVAWVAPGGGVPVVVTLVVGACMACGEMRWWESLGRCD